jgi:hypothetical protein
MLIKRDTPSTASLTHEQRLQQAADQYVAKVAKSAPAPASSERAQYLDRLFAKRAAPTDDTPPAVPVNKAYDRLMGKAEKLHKIAATAWAVKPKRVRKAY